MEETALELAEIDIRNIRSAAGSRKRWLLEAAFPRRDASIRERGDGAQPGQESWLSDAFHLSVREMVS